MAPPKIYPQIAEIIIKEMKTGIYRVGAVFPSLDAMTNIYGISRVTALRVVNILVEKGYVSVARGRKSIVLAREKPLFDNEDFMSRSVAFLADFSMSGSSEITLKMVYAIQHELMRKGCHVRCLQYHENMDLQINDIDAYVIFDVLDAFGEYHELVKKSGKPYVIVGRMKKHVLPNHIHVAFKSALWELISHFLMNRTENYIFLLFDEKSTYRKLAEEQQRKVANWLNEEIVHPLIGTLKTHNVDSAQITVHRWDTRTGLTPKIISKVFRNVTLGTVVIAISENNAMTACEQLKLRGMTPPRDFQLAVIDMIPDSQKEKMNNLYLVRLDIPNIIGKITQSLEYQYSQKSNFAPGHIIHSHLERI